MKPRTEAERANQCCSSAVPEGLGGFVDIVSPRMVNSSRARVPVLGNASTYLGLGRRTSLSLQRWVCCWTARLALGLLMQGGARWSNNCRATGIPSCSKRFLFAAILSRRSVSYALSSGQVGSMGCVALALTCVVNASPASQHFSDLKVITKCRRQLDTALTR